MRQDQFHMHHIARQMLAILMQLRARCMAIRDNLSGMAAAGSAASYRQELPRRTAHMECSIMLRPPPVSVLPCHAEASARMRVALLRRPVVVHIVESSLELQAPAASTS